MSRWNKEQLENMLEDVVNELNLSDAAIKEHGPNGTPPAELVRLVLQQKDATIRNLRAGMIETVDDHTQEKGGSSQFLPVSEGRELTGPRLNGVAS